MILHGHELPALSLGYNEEALNSKCRSDASLALGLNRATCSSSLA